MRRRIAAGARWARNGAEWSSATSKGIEQEELARPLAATQSPSYNVSVNKSFCQQNIDLGASSPFPRLSRRPPPQSSLHKKCWESCCILCSEFFSLPFRHGGGGRVSTFHFWRANECPGMVAAQPPKLKCGHANPKTNDRYATWRRVSPELLCTTNVESFVVVRRLCAASSSPFRFVTGGEGVGSPHFTFGGLKRLPERLSLSRQS
jgi:hypothetical protein